MNKRIVSLIIGLACLTLATHAQTNPPAGGGALSLWDQIHSIFDLNDTNSLVNAQELNLTPIAYWDSKVDKVGGGLKADWWVTDQQGVSISFTEFNDRSSFYTFGYQARTVFKGVEVALGSGIVQGQEDTFGQVNLYLQPSFTYKLPVGKSVDLRLHAGANLIAEQRPSPFLGLTFRFAR